MDDDWPGISRNEPDVIECPCPLARNGAGCSPHTSLTPDTLNEDLDNLVYSNLYIAIYYHRPQAMPPLGATDYNTFVLFNLGVAQRVRGGAKGVANKGRER